MAESKKKSTPCVAFDSDILRTLAEMDEALRKNPKVKFENFRDNVIRSHHEDLVLLLNLIKSKKLDVFIGNTVFQQVKHRPEVLEFIKKYCYFPKLNVITFNDLLYKTDELALQYCTERVEYRGELLYPPMDLNYSPIGRKSAPSDDAYIMAEATIANCLLITGNGQHFIFRKNNKDDTNSRTTGIVAINKKNGYYQEIDEASVVPKAVLFKVFCEWVRSKGVDRIFMPHANTEELELASNIM